MDEIKEVKDVEELDPELQAILEKVDSLPQVLVKERTISETEEDTAIRHFITDAEEVDERKWEKVYMGIKEQGNYFDLVRNMYPFKLPTVLESMQNRKERKYAWWSKENMESKCDPSKLIYWTPVNRTNHPMLTPTMLNKHGGLYREGLYLCYMPWRMYEARCDMQRELARLPTDAQAHRALVENEYGGHYDPTEGGRKSASGSGDTIMEIGQDTHPDEVYDEAGEYVNR